ncbi:hypothetical protein [Actinomadura kijaniata]|uniref:hypothetical protein n=1 Tax=Actinomadura kijaniata TaxID=46161 RepID=UPI000A42E122|nr:hypothetical protein [Actinomadura kijaniata]
MRWTPRRAGWTAVVTGSVTLAGLTAGIPPALADIGADVPYLCITSVGTHRIGVEVAAAKVGPGRTGQQIRIGDVAVALTIPGDAVRDFLGETAGDPPAGAVGVPVSGTALLGVSVVQGARSADLSWPPFPVSGDRVLPEGDERERRPVKMTGKVKAPSLVPDSPGTVTLAAGELVLSLTDGGTAGRRQAIRCAPEKPATLGRIHVRADAAPSPRRSPRADENTTPATNVDCREIPAPGTDPDHALNEHPYLREVFRKPPPPPGRWETFDAPRNLPYCIRAAGFANVRKLGAATPIGAQTLLRRGVKGVRNADPERSVNYSEQYSYFTTHAVPSTASMLGFGFMPTRAVAHVEQVRPPGRDANGRPYPVTGNLRNAVATNGQIGSPRDDEAWGRSYVAMRVGGVDVNGVRLPLGPRCGTGPTPLKIYSFLGNVRTGRVFITSGSTFTGEVTVPDFTGCGVGEDLSPLLTASISGSGNQVRLETGRWCSARNPQLCGEADEPQTLTISPGGRVAITAKSFAISSADMTSSITCDSWSLRPTFKAGRWQQRFFFATAKGASFQGCKLTTPSGETPVKVSSDSTVNVSVNNVMTDGTMSVRFGGLVISAVATVDGRRCELRFGNEPNFEDTETERPMEVFGSYLASAPKDIKGVVFAGSGNVGITPKTDCPSGVPGFGPEDYLPATSGDLEMSPPQKITSP